MLQNAQLWISVSNREESMARVLSRANFHEGTVLHAHRAASSLLIAILEENGWAHVSDRCADLCGALAAHDIAVAADAARAAEALDGQVSNLNLDSAGGAPALNCDAKVAAQSLDCVKLIRSFATTVLST